MATIAQLLVQIKADTDPLRKELNATKRQVRDAFGSEFMSVSNTAVRALEGIGVAIAGVGVAAVRQASKLQSVQTAFTNMLGSAEKSSKFIAELQNFAAKTPFEFNQVTEAAQKFLAFGFTAEQVIPTLMAVGDAAAGVGLGAEGINRVTLAIGQMAAKSKVQSDEMLQLTEAGIPAWQMLADAIGTSVPEAMERVTKGVVDAQTGIVALISGMQSTFGGMMEQQSQTIAGTWSSMMDGIDQSLAAMGLKIADAFNLTEIFQGVGELLTNFAATVNSSGIAEAFTNALPTELQVGFVAFATVLTGVAIPAISLTVTSLAGFLVPLAAGVAAFAPYIAAIGAAAAGMLALYKNGVTVTSALDFMGIKTEYASQLFDNLGLAVEAIGNAVISFVDLIKPAITVAVSLFAGLATGMAKSIGVAINVITQMLNATTVFVTWIADGFNYLFTAITDAVESIAGVLSNMADNILPEWASSGLSTIGNFVDTAVGWLGGLINAITDTNKALGETISEGDGKKLFSGDSGSKAQEVVKTPYYEQFKSSAANAGGGGTGGGKDLAADARQVSKSIEDEWFKTYQNQTAMVEKWYQEQKAALERSAAANSQYAIDRQRLDELYSQKRLEAIQAEADKEREIRESVRQSMTESNSLNVEAYGSAAQQELMQMQTDYENVISGIENRYAELTSNFITMTQQQKSAFLQACTEQGLAYQVMADGMVSFAEQAEADKLAAAQNYENQRLEYLQQCKDIEAEMQDAYNELSFEKLQEALTAENALRLSDMEARQGMMETYQEAYMAAHASNLEMLAELSSTALGGLGDAFTSIFTGAKSAKDAFSDLGKSMIKTIAQFYAKQLAGMLMVSVFGSGLRQKENAKIAADGAAAAAALSPAAWAKLVVSPESAGIATGLLETGLASAAAMGMATSSLVNIGGSSGNMAEGGFSTGNMNALPSWEGTKWAGITGYATGGYFKGPTLGIIGEGKDDEVALPLNRAVFSNIAEGIIRNSSDMEDSGGNLFQQNIYGDINTGADQEELFDDWGAMIRAGLRSK